MHHRWREQLRANQLLAPDMVLASRIIDGPNPLRPNSIAVSDVRAVLLGGELFDAAELDRMRATTEERITKHERRSE